jgi:hypothetical protein
MMMLPAIAALFGASKKMPHQQIRVEDWLIDIILSLKVTSLHEDPMSNCICQGGKQWSPPLHFDKPYSNHM